MRIPVDTPDWAFFLMIAILVIISVFVVLRYALLLKLQKQTVTWIETDGEILYSSIKRNGFIGSILQKGYLLYVQYKYVVDSKEYIGNRTSFLPKVIPSMEMATRIESSYHVGETIKIYYCPNRPSMSVLNKG